MATKIKVRLGLGLSFLRVGLTAGLLMVLLTGTLAAQQKPEDIPDAPSATRPIPPPDARVRGQEWMTRIFRWRRLRTIRTAA